MIRHNCFTIEFGCKCLTGRRHTMEDRHYGMSNLPGCTTGPSAFFGVYDGHAGPETAELAANRLHNILISCTPFQEGRYAEALECSFSDLEKEAIDVSEKSPYHSGTTVVVILIVGNKMWVANLGDCEAVIPESRTTGRRISVVHRPQDPSEKQRIEDAGGFVISSRGFGASFWPACTISRSLGDIEYKYPHNRAIGHFISPVPYIKEFTLTPEIPFIILGCDGLWDFVNETYSTSNNKPTPQITHDNAVELCTQHKDAHLQAEESAGILVQAAIDAGSMDNVTCIVVHLNWH
ncbi:protein phosphatase 2C [Pelomyxa schiedti]|nr:protein phosphatase 2C [Pelomyxa schiedti]